MLKKTDDADSLQSSGGDSNKNSTQQMNISLAVGKWVIWILYAVSTLIFRFAADIDGVRLIRTIIQHPFNSFPFNIRTCWFADKAENQAKVSKITLFGAWS